MSWLNLDSLNSIKGQITKVIQDTVVQPVQEDDEIDHVAKLENATGRIQELTELCTTQDQELSTLRRQILELQQQQQQAKVAECGAGKSTPQEPNASIDDSWFWEADNNTSSSSSKNEEILSKSPSGGDLTIIPLDQVSDTDSHERHQRRFDEMEAKLKKANLENALLSEKVKQITGENRDLNENIEELDKQHSVIVENLLTQKNQLQEKLTEVKSSAELLAKMKKDLAELTAKHEKVESAYVAGVQEGVTAKNQMEALNTELRRAVCENVELVASMEVKNEELKVLMADKEKLQHEFQDFFVKMKDERENESSTVKQLTEKIQCLEEDVQKSSSYCTEIKEKVVELSEQLEREQLEKEALQQEFLAFQESMHELKKNSTDSQKLEDQEFQDMKKKFPLLEEELKQSQQSLEMAENSLRDSQSQLESLQIEKKQLTEDFVALQEDDLTLQREFNDLKEKYRCQEEEVETSRCHLRDLEERLVEVTKCWEEVKIEKRQIEQDFIALQEDDLNLQREFHGFREQQSLDNERISEDNNNLQRQIIDLQSRINSTSVDVGDAKIFSTTIGDLLKSYGKVAGDDVVKALEDFLRDNQDTKYKLEAVEKRLTEAYGGINQQKEEMKRVEHEKQTIQADLMHYEIECSELMKNNEILMSELEEIKSGKLETIQENSEESVAMLEKQLEECNAINRELENDCQTLNERLDERENQLDETLRKINQLEGEGSQMAEKINELKSSIVALENEKSNLQFELTELRVDDGKSQLEEYEKVSRSVEELTKEKNDLINLVTVKHNESVQYHAEIQRLSQLLQQEMTKSVACEKCPELQRIIQDSQMTLQRISELEKLPDQIECLKEKSNLLTNSLLAEQQTVKLLNKEKLELQEEKMNLQKDCDRLRQHLLTVEEDQTTQMVELQRQTEEYKNMLTLLEQEAQKSSTAYTSASIRANQHAETLQAQYMILSQQRDELSSKLSAAEDRESKNQAALINLQCALEQFQRDKDRDIEATTFRIRKQLDDEKKTLENVQNEVKSLQNQLSEAKTGLLAASRISDQLEMSQTNLSAQREEMQKLQEKCLKLEKKMQESETNQADKVEKTLIKNLVIGYVSAPNQGDKSQILKLISAVLDFNQTESDRIGMKTSQNWGNSSGDENQGLAQAFVKFLEKESQPRQPPTGASLLNISHAGNTTKPPVPVKSPEVAPVQPILLSENILQALSPPRNSSSILKDILNDT